MTLATVLATACAGPPTDEPVADRAGEAKVVTIDQHRSLVVTEQAILAGFTLERVMDQLVAQSGVPGLTSLQLFQEWWDTQNPAPGLAGGAIHCDDEVDALGQTTLNGFPYTCRAKPLEGGQAEVNPFANPGSNPDEYIPIGLFNRFDLAPADGSHCGEYRIVYARRGTGNPLERNLVIFEAALPNPHPQQGLKGCKQVVDFWVDLSSNDDVADRAAKLEAFYFDGVANIAPVIHIDHLGAGPSGAGQIRTNQFMHSQVTPRVWSLREFKLACAPGGAGGACASLRVVPVTVKNNPFGGLFEAGSLDPRTADFRADLLAQVPSLAAATIDGIGIDLPDDYNSGQSQASGSDENRFLLRFLGTGTEPNPLHDAIDAELAAIGSPLDAEDIVARAQAMSCAGCHRLNNDLDIGGDLVWPASLGFTHVSERETEPGDGGPRFRISIALEQHFLPHRARIITDYLADKLKPTKSPKDPIGGRRVH
jgi:hypothetical protein